MKDQLMHIKEIITLKCQLLFPQKAKISVIKMNESFTSKDNYFCPLFPHISHKCPEFPWHSHDTLKILDLTCPLGIQLVIFLKHFSSLNSEKTSAVERKRYYSRIALRPFINYPRYQFNRVILKWPQKPPELQKIFKSKLVSHPISLKITPAINYST